MSRLNKVIESAEGETTSFLFFSDPHLHENNSTLDYYLRAIAYIYKNSPLEFVLCGGDWLDNGDTNQRAREKLQFIDDYTYNLFGDDYHLVLGNHDTNYQGRLQDESELHTGLLSHDEIVNILFHREGNSYYTFGEDHARFFVLDSGIDWDHEMDDLRWEQTHWFAHELSENKTHHLVVVLHIYTNDMDGLKTPELFAKHIMEIAETHNNRGTISFNGISYDFSNAVGTVACMLCGHRHEDFISQDYSVPVIGTTHLKDGGEPTFDLCIFDWERNVLNLLRVGTGSDRTVILAK